MRFRTMLPVACAAAFSFAGLAYGQVDPAALKRKSRQASVEEAVAKVDAEVKSMWQKAEVEPTERASDSEWVRRVYLDIIGRIPTHGEASKFLADKSADKRGRLIDTLVDSDEAAEHFAIYFGNLLVGRIGGDNAAEIGVDKRAFEKWAAANYAGNVPYDQWVMQLITAKGTARENGPSNFIIRVAGDATEVATRCSQFFLGIQIQCAQCHNHPFDEWKQADFWGVVGFFVRTRVEVAGGRRPGQLYRERTVVDKSDSREEAEYYIKNDPRLPRQTQLPKLLKDDAEVINKNEYNNQGVDRRYEFARWVTDPRTVGGTLFAKASVNRMWYYLLGKGIVNPVDDMGSSKRPVSIRLLNELADDFTNSGYDLKRLIRVIARSAPYNLSSKLPKQFVSELAKAKVRKPGSDDAEGGAKIEMHRSRFTHFYLKTMTPEQLFYSIVIATGGEDAKEGRHSETYINERNDLLNQFVTLIDVDENKEVTRFEGSIPLALRLLNGDIINKRISAKAPGFSYYRKIAKGDGDMINTLFMATLSRAPSPGELNTIQARMKARTGDARFEDVFWSLLNTAEFMFIH